jgi:DNA polymerase-1
VRLVLQIHDELVFEIDKDIAEKVADDVALVLESVLKKRNLTELPLVVSRSLGANLHAI